MSHVTHTSISYVTHVHVGHVILMNVSRHTYKWVMLHTHIAKCVTTDPRSQSGHTLHHERRWRMSHTTPICRSHGIRMNKSYIAHMNVSFYTHAWMCRVNTRMNVSCHTHTWMCRVTHTHECVVSHIHMVMCRDHRPWNPIWRYNTSWASLMYESCHTHTHDLRHTRTHESCHSHECVTSHVWLSHVAQTYMGWLRSVGSIKL